MSSKVIGFGIAVAMVLSLGYSGLAQAEGNADDGMALFNGKGKCQTCHQLSKEKLVGPGLKGVTTRHSEEWLTKWLHDPAAVWNEESADTRQLRGWNAARSHEAKTPMQTIPPLTDADIADLIAFLKRNG